MTRQGSAEVSNQTSQAETIFGIRELGGLLWAYRWLLLICALAGLGWGLLKYPPGEQMVRSEITVGGLSLPAVQSLQDIDRWTILAVEAGLDPNDGAARNHRITMLPGSGRMTMVIESAGVDTADHNAALARLRASFRPATDIVTGMVQKRLDVLRTIGVAPSAQYLVVHEAFQLQVFLDAAKTLPGGIFKLDKRSIKTVPMAGLETYIRYILIALSGGVASSIALYLLLPLWRERNWGSRTQ